MAVAGAIVLRREVTQRLGSALRVCRLHEPGNLAVEEALNDLFPLLVRYLEVSQRMVLLKEDDRIFLDERYIGAGSSDGGWIDEMAQVLGQLGIGALLFSGAWTLEDLRRVFTAFGTARGSPAVCRDQVTAGARGISAQARLDVLGPDEARHLGVEQRDETPLPLPARANFLYARLSALAATTHQQVAEGGSPDVHEGLIRQSLMDVVEGLESQLFEWRILALSLMPPLPRLASHAADVAVLSLAMGRLLGLDRGDLIELGYAGFYASLGRAGRSDPGSSREVTQDGVLRALRGGPLGGAGVRRLITCRELLKPDPDAHPFSLIIGVADAYARLIHGLLGVEAQTPHAALTAVRANHHPAAVGLLEDVVSRYPAGSFLRLADGAVGLVLDGGARRGHRPRGRVVMSASGGSATDDAVTELNVGDAPEVLDPSSFGIQPYKLVLGSDAEEDEEDHLALPRSPETTRISLRERESVKHFLDGLVKAIRFHRLYPADHPLCTKGVAEVFDGATALLGVRPSLEMRLTRAGTAVGHDLVQTTQAGASDLASLLVPSGVRRLRFLQGLGKPEVEGLIVALAAFDEHGEGDDLLRELWQQQMLHVEVVVYDPLSPARVRRPADPSLEPVAAVIRDLLKALPSGDRRLEHQLERGWEADEADGVSPEACGAWPEWIPLFLQSDAGAARAEFRDQLPDAPSELRRASEIVAWAASRLPIGPEELARARASLVAQGLALGDQALVRDLAQEARGEDERLDALTSTRIATFRNLGVMAVRIERASASSEVVGETLELLRILDDAAVAPTCEFYATLTGSEQVGLREVFATFLLDRIETCAAELIPLTLSRDAEIAREALILLGQGGAGSAGFTILEQLAHDKNHKARAEAAQEMLDQLTGAGARRAALKGIQEGKDTAERVAHARRLAKVGDASSYTALLELVKRRDFATRPAEEIEALLSALAALGQARAAPILQELSEVKSGLLGPSKGAKVVAKLAKATLAQLKQQRKKKTETVRIQAGACPKCRFSNVPGASRCLQCGTSLDGKPTKKQAPASHETVRIKKDDLLARVASAVASAKTKSGTHKRSADSGKTQRIPRATSPAKPTAPAARAWLSYPLLPPVALADQVVTVGRLASCDLVLVHESVSRTHVVLRPVGERWVLEDRSSYGTWINGERALSKQVGPGDVITVGPYDLKIEAEQVDADPNAITRTLRTFASSEAVGGRLERVSLAEVIQQLEFNQKTGTLEVFSDDGTNGVLVVYEGKPMFAEMADLRDEEAVYRMLSLKKGNFSFRAKIEAGEMTMSISLTGLLMEASRRIDEGS